MQEVRFSVLFRGGLFGFIEIKLRKNGHLYGYPVIVRKSGTVKINLEPGLYLISVKGASPPNGTRFSINKTTNPATPDDFAEGPIYGSYVLSI